MGVLTDLIVAPASDAPAVARTRSNERPWIWQDAKGLGVEDVAAIHRIIDGGNYVEAFDVASVDEEVVVVRVPRVVVEALAKLDTSQTAELAMRSGVAAAYLEIATPLAKAAIERGHELFVWTCP